MNKTCDYCKNPTKEVFKVNKKEICEDCLWEKLDEFWDHGVERIIKEIREHNNNYSEWNKWFYTNHSTCDGPYHPITWWLPHEELANLGGGEYCESCIEWMIEDSENFAAKSIYSYFILKKEGTSK